MTVLLKNKVCFSIEVNCLIFHFQKVDYPSTFHNTVEKDDATGI